MFLCNAFGGLDDAPVKSSQIWIDIKSDTGLYLLIR